MNKILRYVRLIVPAAIAILFAPAALAAACTSAATGNWSAAATWAAPCNIAGGPVAADTVTIAAAHTVTVDVNSAATSITIAAPSVAAHGININPGIALTVSGAITMTAPAANNRTSTLAVGSGMLNAGGLVINGGTSGTRISQVTVSTGTITVTGAITSGGTVAQARLISTGASMISVGGNFTPGALVTTATGTINFNGGAAQTMKAFTTYNNVTVNKAAGDLSLVGTTTIGGDLSVNAGTFTVGAFTLTVNGTTSVSDTLSITSATGIKTFVGAVTINSPNGAWTNTTEAVTFRGGLTHNGATFTAGTGIYTFATTAAQALNCATALAIPRITVTAPTVLTNNCPGLTIATALAGTGNLTNSAAATLNISGTSAITTLTATATGNLVNYNGAAAQTIKATTYSNVTINKPIGIAASLAGTTTISGTLDVTTGTLTAGAYTLTVTGATTVDGTLSITSATGTKTFVGAVTINSPNGAWTNTTEAVTFRGGLTHNGATFTAGTGVYTFDTTAAQALNCATALAIPRITVTTPTVLTNNCPGLTVATALIGTGNLTNTAAGILNIGGTSTVTTLTATDVGNTVNYTGAAQTVKPVAYSNLGLAGSGVKTLTGVNTVGGNLTMSGTATATAAAALTVGGSFSIGATNTFANGANALNVAGNFAQGGTFTAGAGVVTLNGGAAVQTISGAGPLGFAKLTVNNTGGITLARNVTVTSAIIGAVTLTSTCPIDYTLTSNGGATVQHSCTMVNSINRADPDPTSAATVSWTVIFNNSVAGVDATAFTLAASGVSGAYITTVAGSGTTWTVTANTGIGTGTLGLNQTGPGVVVPTLGGTFTGQVYTITSTPALAEYRLDEAAWNGTANEVADSSGSYPGTAANTAIPPPASTAFAGDPAYTSGVQSTCRYGLFDSTTSPVQSRTYVDLKSTFPKLNSNYTVAAWIRSNDITRTGQRIFVNDDANQGWAISLGDGGAGRLRVFNRSAANSGTPTAGGYNPGCGVFCLGTNPGVITNGAWYFVAVTVDTVDKQVTLYAWDSALTPLVATSTAYTGTWGTDPGATAIGGETSVSGEYGGTFAFVGNIDEVRVYQKVLNPAALTTVATQTRVCAVIVTVDHVTIDAPTVAATLTDVPITIEAHDTAHTPLSIESTINLSTSTGAGDWANDTGTGIFTPGAANSGLATYTFGPGETSVTLDFNYPTAGVVTINVADGGGSDLLLNTPAGEKANVIDFTASSFVFTDSACVDGTPFGAPGCTILNWSPQIAGQDVTNVYITAVNGAGVPTRLHRRRDRTRNMQFGLSCRDPVANAGIQATLGGVTLPLCEANGATPTAWSATLSALFPGGIPSAGPYIFNYADVGQVNLWMQNSASPGQIGASGSFVVKPGGFVLSNIQQTAVPNLVNPAAAGAGGTKFVKAGEMFSVTVTATTCTPTSATCTVAGVATPNYGNETASESVLLTSALVAPGGGNNPAIDGTFGAFTGGAATGTAFTWGEVGIINLTPSVGDGDYLGEGDVIGTTSGNVGRFFPDHFDTAVFATATLPMPCPTGLTCPTLYDGFVYSGQPFSVQVIARNLAGGTTANYDGSLGFSKAVTLTAWDALGGTTQNPGSGTLGSNAVAAAAFISGVATLTDTPTYTFATSPTAPTDIYVRAVDTDGVTSLRAASVEGGMKVASGRVKIGNAHGSELLPLPMTATVQYYSGTNWLTSLTDSVTSLTLALSNYQCKSGCAWTTTPTPAGGQVIAGVLPFKLSKPSSGGTGSVDVNIGGPNYLLTGSNGAAVNPSKPGRATFGVYKGNNEFIYLRETY